MRLKKLLTLWVKSGRAAFHFPRKKRVRLNGHRSMTEKEAVDYLESWIERGAK